MRDTTYKNRFRQFICMLISLFLVFSCTNEKEGLQTFKLSELLEAPEKAPLSSFASSIEEIPLEINEECLIGNFISQIITTDYLLFIIHDTRCSVFDKSGKYLYDISKRGEGPHEYIQLTNVFLEDNYICLYDASRKKILFFTHENEFIKEMNIPESFGHLYPIQNNIYAGYLSNRSGKEKTKIKFFNSSEVIDSIPYPQEYNNNGVIMIFYNECSIFSSGNTYSFKEIFNDTIYTIHKDYQVTPRLVLGLGIYNPTQEYRHSITDPTTNLFEEKMWIMPVGENDSYLFINGLMNKKTSSFYWDKRKNSMHNIQLTYPDNMGYEEFFIPRFISADKKKLIGYEESEEGNENPTIIIATLHN